MIISFLTADTAKVFVFCFFLIKIQLFIYFEWINLIFLHSMKGPTTTIYQLLQCMDLTSANNSLSLCAHVSQTRMFFVFHRTCPISRRKHQMGHFPVSYFLHSIRWCWTHGIMNTLRRKVHCICLICTNVFIYSSLSACAPPKCKTKK